MVFGDANFTQSLLKLGREKNHHHETDQKLVTTHLTHLMSGGDIKDGPRPVLHHVAVGQKNVVVVQTILVSTHIALIHNGQICNVKPSIKYCTNNRGRIVRLLRSDEILKSTINNIFKWEVTKHWWDDMGEGSPNDTPLLISSESSLSSVLRISCNWDELTNVPSHLEETVWLIPLSSGLIPLSLCQNSWQKILSRQRRSSHLKLEWWNEHHRVKKINPDLNFLWQQIFVQNTPYKIFQAVSNRQMMPDASPPRPRSLISFMLSPWHFPLHFVSLCPHQDLLTLQFMPGFVKLGSSLTSIVKHQERTLR